MSAVPWRPSSSTPTCSRCSRRSSLVSRVPIGQRYDLTVRSTNLLAIRRPGVSLRLSPRGSLPLPHASWRSPRRRARFPAPTSPRASQDDQARRLPGDPAPALRVRADPDPARAEQHRGAAQPEQADGARLHHALQAQPRLLGHAQGPARRRDPPAPRRLADQRLSDLRRRRGEDDPPAPARLRLPLQPERPLDHELHDPQPDAEADAGVDHLRHRLRARQHAPPPTKLTAAQPLWMDVAGLCAPTRSSTRSRAQGKTGKFTFPNQANAAQQDDIGPRARVRGRPRHDAR